MIKKNIKKIDNYTYFYKKEDTVTYIIDIYFTFETSKINYVKANILSRYLTRINSKYKNRKEIYDKTRELYNASLNFNTCFLKDISLFEFRFRCLDYKRVKDNYLEDAINFSHQMLFNLYTVNGKLDSEQFRLIKEELFNEYFNLIKDQRFEFMSKVRKTVYPDGIQNLKYYESKEELQAILDSITDKDIIGFYNEIINNHFKTLFFGNYSNKDIKMIMDSFKFNHSKIKKVSTLERLLVKKEYNEYISKDYSQSVLVFTYSVKDFDKYCKPYFRDVLAAIANSKDGLLLGLLRGKYGLVYHSSASLNVDIGAYSIEAFIDKDNKEKTMDVIKEFFRDMHNKKLVKDKLDYAKEKIKEDVFLSLESPYKDYGLFTETILYNEMSDRTYIKNINKITVDDIINFFDNLENENIFYYVGDKNE